MILETACVFRQQSVTIAAGECEHHGWCGTCGAPSRTRLSLHDGDPEGPLLAVVEVCPGCGENHATPMVKVTPADPPGPLARFRRQPVPQESLCAFGDCKRRSSREHVHEMAGDEGTWRYGFCGSKHKAAWLASHGLRSDVPSR